MHLNEKDRFIYRTVFMSYNHGFKLPVGSNFTTTILFCKYLFLYLITNLLILRYLQLRFKIIIIRCTDNEVVVEEASDRLTEAPTKAVCTCIAFKWSPQPTNSPYSWIGYHQSHTSVGKKLTIITILINNSIRYLLIEKC